MDRITDARGVEYDATKFTYESEKVIDVNEKGQTVVTEREINTYGFVNRNPGFFPGDIGLNKMLQHANKDNKSLLKITKRYIDALVIDIDIKIVGLILAITIYPQAMMISVFITSVLMARIKN